MPEEVLALDAVQAPVAGELSAFALPGWTTQYWELGRPRPRTTPTRDLAIARPEDPALVHLAVVGDTYTVLFSGEQTAGGFAMLDILIPPGGGPPPHRHDFEECFRVLEGSLEVRVRDLPPVRLEARSSDPLAAASWSV
jgi:mannose-6-phosphate isomerase-like protein (cupin superfamily)